MSVLDELKKSTEAAIANGEVVESLESGKIEDNDNIRLAEENLKRKESRVKVTKSKSGKNVLKGLKIKVIGTLINKEGATAYEVEPIIPYCNEREYQYFLQRFVQLELIKKGIAFSSIIDRPIESVDECDIDPTWIGKSPFELTKDECYMAAAYYGLKPMPDVKTPSLMAIQKALYAAYVIKITPELQSDRSSAIFRSEISSKYNKKDFPELLLKENIV